MTRTGHKALADRINPDFCISEMFLRQLLFSAFSYAKMLRNGLLALAGGQTRVILFPPRRRGPAQRRRREWRAHTVPPERQDDDQAPAQAAHPTCRAAGQAQRSGQRRRGTGGVPWGRSRGAADPKKKRETTQRRKSVEQ